MGEVNCRGIAASHVVCPTLCTHFLGHINAPGGRCAGVHPINTEHFIPGEFTSPGIDNIPR